MLATFLLSFARDCDCYFLKTLNCILLKCFIAAVVSLLIGFRKKLTDWTHSAVAAQIAVCSFNS